MNIKRFFKTLAWKNYYLYKFLHYVYDKIKKSPYNNYSYSYPYEFDIELSSFCNSHCDFCCRDYAVSAGDKKLMHMNLITARLVFEKLKNIMAFNNTPNKELKIAYIGLGEALMNPNSFEIFELTKEYFPNAFIQLNTNGILLNDIFIHKIIDSPIDSIVLSLCFYNKELHSKHLGVDKYEKIITNTLKLIKSRKGLKPFLQIHIFDLPENRKYFREFTAFWENHINSLDSLLLFHYADITSGMTKLIKYPCSLPWSQLAVDTEGFFYPCCIGPMIKRNDFLCAGNYNDSNEAIMLNIEKTRKNHIDGIYDVCLLCGNIERDYKNNKKFFISYKKYLRRTGSNI